MVGTTMEICEQGEHIAINNTHCSCLKVVVALIHFQLVLGEYIII